MNWDRIEGNWKKFAGNAKLRWGGLTGDRLVAVTGKRQLAAGRTQETFGIVKDAADKRLIDIQKELEQLK